MKKINLSPESIHLLDPVSMLLARRVSSPELDQKPSASRGRVILRKVSYDTTSGLLRFGRSPLLPSNTLPFERKSRSGLI